MDFERSPWEKFNKILTAAALFFLGAWAWKWFGPESSGAQGFRVSFTLWELFWLGVAVACGGYLLWRFLCWFFWRKYFGGKPPPDEPM